MSSRTTFITALGAAGLIALTAACSSSADEAGGEANREAQDSVEEIAALVPDSIREAGVIRVGTAAAYPPVSFLDSDGNFTGSDADMARAVGEVLDLDVQFENLPFDGVLAGILADRFDAAWSVLSVTEERMEEVDFVTYMEAGTQILVLAGNPDELDDEESLCGHSLGVVKGSTQDLKVVPTLSDACEEAALDPIDKIVYPGQAESNQALVAGRVSGTLDDGSVLSWQAQQNPDVFELHTLVVDPSPMGVAVSKDNPELSEAIREATQYLIDNGSYDEILEEWNLGDGAIPTSEYNPEV